MCGFAADRDWPATPKEARAVQERLRARVVRSGGPERILRVAGLDAHYDPKLRRSVGAAVLLSWPECVLLESALACRPVHFPYVPGLLSFREAPVLLAALELLRTRPDLLFVDGQGYAHPRRFGLACHIGLLTGIPAIGVAKSRLVGAFHEPGAAAGARSPLYDREEVVGAVVRTREGTRPLFVSVGHGIALEAAVALVLAACRGYRLPEPTRLADRLSRAARR